MSLRVEILPSQGVPSTVYHVKRFTVHINYHE